MKTEKSLIKLLSLMCLLSFVLSACSPVYEHMPETTDLENTEFDSEEYFSKGEVVCISSANLGIVYEGQWIYVESALENDIQVQRLVKYNPITNTVSSVCLNPTCLHSNEECKLCAPSMWLFTYFAIFGNWVMYTYSDVFADKDEFETKKTYLYNLKTGELRELHARSKEGLLLSKTTTNYVMDGKIYSTLLELDYTGEEEYNSKHDDDGFIPETHQFLEVYDPETQKVERLCEIPNNFLFIGITNKRFFFKDPEGLVWSSNYKGENITNEKNMNFDLFMVCGKYVYPAEDFDYNETGYNIQGYDLETDSLFNIDFGMQIGTALVDSGMLCFTTLSNIDEYKEYLKNPSAYLSKHYPDVTDRGQILTLKSKIRNKFLYSGTFQMYLTDARGENRRLVFEGNHMSFIPQRISGNYIFGTISYGDPNNDFQRIDTDEDGRCVINIETGEITLIPTLELYLEK